MSSDQSDSFASAKTAGGQVVPSNFKSSLIINTLTF
jgi:hypothetical protein